MTGRGGECVRVPGAALQQPAGQAARLSQLRHHHPLLPGHSPLRSLRQVNLKQLFWLDILSPDVCKSTQCQKSWGKYCFLLRIVFRFIDLELSWTALGLTQNCPGKCRVNKNIVAFSCEKGDHVELNYTNCLGKNISSDKMLNKLLCFD